MTRGSILEYTEAIRWRYLKARKKEKGKILDEFTQVTGYHRKAAIRLIHREDSPGPRKRQGKRRCYGPEVVDGLVKVIDFGIAKTKYRKSDETEHGILKGKISYMSPEQIDLKPIDHRSDLFSVGVILFEVITGEKLSNRIVGIRNQY